MNNILLEKYIKTILESNPSFIDIYGSYFNDQDQEDQDQEDQGQEDQDMNILVDPYAYYNYPEYSENNNENDS
tara:strand:- start:96 stop:314 length:219 start_codon:yes stop_codon:yes gene_type:complete